MDNHNLYLYVLQAYPGFQHPSTACEIQIQVAAKIKLSTPREMVIKILNKMAAVHGAASTKGMEMAPQASPATICCHKVKEAAKILPKPLGQRSPQTTENRLARLCGFVHDLRVQKQLL